MKTSKKVKVSITVLIICMTVGFLFLLFAYRGPVWGSLIVALVYAFILRFLLFTVKRLVKALEDTEKNEEKTVEK